MDLIWLVLGIALLGFVVYLITTHIPMDPIFKTLIYIVCVIVVILFAMRLFGGSVPNVMP